jgi:hypothetical protein
VPRVTYRFVILSFFDILGFRELLKVREPYEVARVLRLFQKTSKPRKETARIYAQAFFQFSDSVVRTVNVRSPANQGTGVIFSELSSLLNIQVNLVAEGVLIRGGVTIGEAYERSPLLFGPAMNRGYLLESKTAVFPRIVVGEEMIEALKIYPPVRLQQHSFADERGYLESMTRRSRHGGRFLDYLAYAAREGEPEEYVSLLGQHRDLILRGAALPQSDTRTRTKYRWLTAYHNDAVDRIRADFLRRYQIDRRSLRVPYQVIRPLPFV